MVLISIMKIPYVSNSPVAIVAYQGPNKSIRIAATNEELNWNPIFLSCPYCVLSERLDYSTRFIMSPIGSLRPILKKIRESNIFTDTGKRVEITKFLWGEVWQLQPKHQSLLEKESNNGSP